MLIETDAQLPTWFKVGGRADRLARPTSIEDVRRCLEIDPALVVLGDGANLLVDDAGVDRLVVAMTSGPMRAVRRDERTGLTIAGAGASLFRMIPECARLGLAGLETLAGIPATVGGALVMNAGGAFGQIADVVVRVHGVDRAGRAVTLERSEIGFGYRTSGLERLVLLSAELDLRPDDPARVRARMLEIMEYKKRTQPMEANSAGCAFKNPVAPAEVFERLGVERPEHGRISAGLLIDRAGCKGLRLGSAEVSQRHANFLFAHDGGRAGDVIALMAEVERRVRDRFGVAMQREVVVWRRGSADRSQG